MTIDTMAIVKKYEADLVAQAKAAFAQHVVSDQAAGRWEIARPHEDGRGFDGNMRAEIISMRGGIIHVGGDIDSVSFGVYSDANDDERKLKWMGRWMGRHTDVGYYVQQKATIGMGGSRALTEVSHAPYSAALLREVLADEDRSFGDDDREVMREALERLDKGADVEEVESDLARDLHTDYAIELGGLGRVVAPRVVFAWAAIARLCDLLWPRQPVAAPAASAGRKAPP